MKATGLATYPKKEDQKRGSQLRKTAAVKVGEKSKGKQGKHPVQSRSRAYDHQKRRKQKVSVCVGPWRD